jgi:simple sugar transport system permease protein
VTALAALIQDSEFWAAVCALSTPLIFGVMGALLCACAGEINFAVAGLFAIGALVAFVVGQHDVGPWMALGAAVGSGFVIGVSQGVLTGPFGVSQPLTGIAISLLGLAVAPAGWPDNPTPAATLHEFHTEFLSRSPYAGEMLARQSPLVFLAVLTALILAYVLNRTPLGLAIRACGDNPLAVEAQGRSVHALRIGATAAGSAFMAAGGAAVALMPSVPVSPDTVGAQGFLCLALAAAAGWRPGFAFAAALLFGINDAASPHLQQEFGVHAPIMALLPYLLAIVILVATRRRLRWPAVLSAGYVRPRSR